MGRKKSRSLLQKASAQQNLARGPIQGDKENAAEQAGPSFIGDEVRKEHARGDDYRRLLNQTRRTQRRATEKCRTLMTEMQGFGDMQNDLYDRIRIEQDRALMAEEQVSTVLQDLSSIELHHENLKERYGALRKEKEKYRARDTRAPGICARAVEKALQTNQESHVYQVKDSNGVVTDTARSFVQDLVSRGIAVENVYDTIHSSASHLGVPLAGSISVRTVSRIVAEGGIAAKLKVANELAAATAISISCDGTSHRNIQYESKHVTLSLPGHTNPVTRTLGISSAPNHTSQEQLEGWKHDLADLCDLRNQLPSHKDKPKLDTEDIAAKIKGMGSDHAEDQKKLSRLMRTWKVDSNRQVQGRAIFESLDASSMLDLLLQETERSMAEVGGERIWDQLSEDELEKKQADVFRALCTRLGEEAYLKLSAEEQKEVDLFIWGGCCMHKEQNTVKWGNTRMRAWWQAAGIAGPLSLPNKAASGSTGSLQSIESGAVKATSLAGSIFNNKDDKKGQHNVCRQFFEQRLGYQVRFPDTSNTRFQSHCQASEELLLHLELYQEFLEHVRDSKKDTGFTNIESNVYRVLFDAPTLTEMAVLVLYSQAVSQPYMRSVRNQSIASRNLLDLGPLHKKVKAHCRAIISNPDLILASDSSYETGALDRKLWQRPEAIYKVKYLATSMPHLRELLVVFFQGALDGWEKFTSEFAADSEITTATASTSAQVFINATNDLNEGALGAFRVTLRLRPHMSLHQYNARALYKTNEAATYLTTLDPEDRQFLRRAARQIDSDQVEKKRRLGLAEAQEEHVAQKRMRIELRESKKNAVKAKLDGLTLRLNVADIEQRPGNAVDLLEQIEWHRRHDLLCLKQSTLPKKTVIRSSLKQDKIRTLIEAVDRFNLHWPSCTQREHDCELNTLQDNHIMARVSGSEGPIGGYDRYDEECESDDGL